MLNFKSFKEPFISEENSVNFSPDKSELFLTGPALKICKKSERLIIESNGKNVCEIPLFRLKTIHIRSKGILFSSDVVKECSDRGINMYFQYYSGEPYAVLNNAFIGKDAELERKQLLCYYNEFSGRLCKKIIGGKINNQCSLLKYVIKNKKSPNEEIRGIQGTIRSLEILEENINALPDAPIDEIRQKILGIEGSAARIYWQAFAVLLKNSLGFSGRLGKGEAADPVNAMLNYGYAIIYNHIWNYILQSGLNPYAGFLHTAGPNKLSLVYDMTEEFRAVSVDRAVLSYINNKKKAITLNEEGLLYAEDREGITMKIISRLETPETYIKKKQKLQNIMKMQIFSLSDAIKKQSEYYPFSFKW